MKLTKPQLQTIATSIFRYFHAEDEPPADEIFVPTDAIRPDEDVAGVLTATVRFVTHYCVRKVHSIKIKFKLDQFGRFDSSTYEYI
jgi:hypothetical protein